MAFTPIDLPIQEILQTDFITDIAQIHNSNVLILKDKIEDIINILEIDTVGITIGADTPINNLRTQNIIIQDGGFTFQSGIPTQIIAKLDKLGNGQSRFNVDNLEVDINANLNNLTANSATFQNSLTSAGDATFNSKVKYDASIIESSESVSCNFKFDGINEANGRLNLTSTSRRNIYVTASCETALGAEQIWTGSSLNPSITTFSLYIDFDANNPPSPNTTFTIYLVDVVENSASSSISNQINLSGIPFTFNSGLNISTGNTPIILHNDVSALGLNLGINPSSSNPLNNQITNCGSNITINYILSNSVDKLILRSLVGVEVF
jgi:hypothetical protein